MVSVHFVTLLVFILGATVVRMNGVRRLCVTAVVQPHGSVSAASVESHCSAVVAVAQLLGGATAKLLKAPITWQSPATECSVCKQTKKKQVCRKEAFLCIMI
jgi:hypothetical protein